MPTKTMIDLANPALDTLTPFQECLYWRIVHLFRCYPTVQELSASPADLKQTLYPLKRDLRENQVQSALAALTLAGMIAVYPDDAGHPYLRLISAASPTSHGGDYRGGGGGRGCSSNAVSSSSERNGEGGETITNPTDSLSVQQGYAEHLGLIPEEAEAAMERYQQVEEAAKRYDLNSSAGCVQDALELAETYSMEWLLKAMKLARDAKWKWKFVETQLARWQEAGGPDAEAQTPEKREQHSRSANSSLRRSKKTDAELDAELKKWGVNTDG